MTIRPQIQTQLLLHPKQHLKLIFVRTQLPFGDYPTRCVNQHIVMGSHADICTTVDHDPQQSEEVTPDLFPILECDGFWFDVDSFTQSEIRLLFHQFENIGWASSKVGLDRNANIVEIPPHAIIQVESCIRAGVILHIDANEIPLLLCNKKDFAEVLFAKALIELQSDLCKLQREIRVKMLAVN